MLTQVSHTPEEPIEAVVVEPAAIAEELDIGVVHDGIVVVQDLSHGAKQPLRRSARDSSLEQHTIIVSRAQIHKLIICTPGRLCEMPLGAWLYVQGAYECQLPGCVNVFLKACAGVLRQSCLRLANTGSADLSLGRTRPDGKKN